MKNDYLATNRDIWNADAANWVELARSRWSLDTPTWGTWDNPEATLKLLPADMRDVDAIELG